MFHLTYTFVTYTDSYVIRNAIYEISELSFRHIKYRKICVYNSVYIYPYIFIPITDFFYFLIVYVFSFYSG